MLFFDGFTGPTLHLLTRPHPSYIFQQFRLGRSTISDVINERNRRTENTPEEKANFHLSLV